MAAREEAANVPSGPRSPVPSRRCEVFRGMEGLRRLLSGANAMVALTAGSRLTGSLFQLGLDDDFMLTGGTMSAPAHSTGLIAPDCVTATVVLDEGGGGGHLNGADVVSGALFLFRPGGLYEGWTSAGYRWVSIHVRREAALQLARHSPSPLPTLRGTSVASTRISASDLAWARSWCEKAGCWQPVRGAVPLEPDLADELRAGWGRILASGWRRALVKAASRMDLRSEAVLQRVDAYIRAHRGDPIYVADLCKAAAVPERTLQHVFRRRFALRPMEYVTSIRLDQARRAIFDAASGGGATVARIAASVGFDHMGRFAALYRRVFGETPRDTVLMLRRRNATARGALSRAASRG